MALDGNRTFVGFGFGPIQTGLFIHEAHASGNFGRIVVAEVLPGIVSAVRDAGGLVEINVAHESGVESRTLGPVEILDPGVAADRARLIEAVRQASEVATAVPSVRHYSWRGEASIDALLARGLATREGHPLLVYAAENHHRAAGILRDAVRRQMASSGSCEVDSRAIFVNTVIGKMSGVIGDPAEAAERGLRPLTPAGDHYHLVEAFNRILIERARTPSGKPIDRGITVFEEKDDLVPFEEAKLYGHNAVHALAAYLAAYRGLENMSDLPSLPGALSFLRDAFVEESGAGLSQRHAGRDALFTPERFAVHVDDLLARMFNRHLGDRVARVARDPARKLGWGDRLVGTVRLALEAGVAPRRFALGTAAALLYFERTETPPTRDVEAQLSSLWATDAPDRRRAREVVGLVQDALASLRETGWP